MKLHWLVCVGWLGVGACSGDGDGGGSTSTAADDGSGSAADATAGSASASASATTAGSASGSGSAGDGTTGATTGGGPGGECTEDADCPGGGPCIELTPGGVTVCIDPIVEAMSCSMPKIDECCSTDECAEGVCVSTATIPSCSGAAVDLYNQCMVDGCTDDADCAPARCIPAGALGFPVAMCVQVACASDADCTEAPGGACVLEPSTTCCNDVLPRCRYPDTPPVGDDCPP